MKRIKKNNIGNLSFFALINVLSLTISSLSSFLYAADFSVRGDYNKETKSLSPSYSLEWSWDKTFSSSVDAKYSKDIELSKIEGYSQSNDATEIKVWNLRVNALSFNFTEDRLSAFIGGTGSYEYIKKGEFGYFQLPASMSSTWVTFDNKIEIKAFIPCVTAGFKYKSSMFNTSFRGDFFPSYYLKVKQDTAFNPIMTKHGLSDESKWQKAGYSVRIDLALRTSAAIFADIVFRGESDYLRTDYEIDFLNYNAGAWSFKKGTVDVSTTNNSAIIALALSSEVFGGTSPLVGFGKNWEITKDRIKNESETEKQWIMTFGLDSKVDFE